MMKKISIVTPVYNGEKYIEKNIKSIINQDYDNYEHIIVDGGSTDGTLRIIERYAKEYPIIVISEKDDGMYDAIEKGFKVSNGEIMAWLNADDVYMPWAFKIMNATISDNTLWCTGMNAWQDENDTFYKVADLYLYKREWIKKGYYDGRFMRFVQQESVYWSRKLWNQVYQEGMLKQYHYAGDFHLWKMFAKVSDLYSVATVIGGFRFAKGQKSEDISAYYSEVGKAVPGFVKRNCIRMRALLYQQIGQNKIVYPIHEKIIKGVNKVIVNPL